MATYKLNYSGEKIDELFAKTDNLGVGNADTSGTVKLSDSAGTSGVADGVAATPKAVNAAADSAAKSAVASAKTYTDSTVKEAVTGLNSEIDEISKSVDAVDKKVDDAKSELQTEISDLDTRVGVVEKQIANINLDDMDWRNILLDIADGTASKKYPVGTQIITDWDRTDAYGNKINYKPEWNIMHYQSVECKDSLDDESDQTANAMFLEWDKTIPDDFAFCVPQALQCFDGTEGSTDGLPAGTYTIKMKAPNGSSAFRTLWDGKYATLVLTKAIPSGGTLRVSVSDWNGTSTEAISLVFKTYSSNNQNDAAIETYTASTSSDTLPTGAIYLGEVWGEDVGYGILNYPEECYYGNNTWAQSDLRQWLNGDGANWWSKQTRYGIKPNIANSLQGFLTGLDSGIKSVLKYVKVKTIGNNVKYKDQSFITYDKIFLHSFNQSNITTDFSSQFDNEGERWEYYKQLAQGVSNLNAQGMFKVWNTYPVLIRYAINATTSAQYVFSRSSGLNVAYDMHFVYASGDCSYASASYGGRCLPACAIVGSDTSNT